MVFVIRSSDVHRNQARSSWVKKGIVFTSGSLVMGLVAGAVLGYSGSLVPRDVRLGLGTLLAFAAVACGLVEVAGRRIRPPQWNRETPQRWMYAGPLRAALRNGLTLGLGLTTRIGFVLWYAVPVGAFLTGDPVFGAVIYATYSLTRGITPWIMISWQRLYGQQHGWTFERIGTSLPRHAVIVKRIAAGQLVFLGIAVLAHVGV
jgi:hypothetical protein